MSTHKGHCSRPNHLGANLRLVVSDVKCSCKRVRARAKKYRSLRDRLKNVPIASRSVCIRALRARGACALRARAPRSARAQLKTARFSPCTPALSSTWAERCLRYWRQSRSYQLATVARYVLQRSISKIDGLLSSLLIRFVFGANTKFI